MAKSNVSEWDAVADNNITINGININENCPPSAINNAIREVMAQIKMWKDGYTDPISGVPIYQSLVVQNIDVKGMIQLDGSAGTDGQVLLSRGASASPVWGDAFVRGMILLWSGSTGSVPSGWRLCDGVDGTPDLRNRFVVGAGSSYAVNATGGSANATLPAHSHTANTSNTGNHAHDTKQRAVGGLYNGIGGSGSDYNNSGGTRINTATAGAHSHNVAVSSAGVSATNANLPPYYALAYIMKL
jgi:hypothetical protein